MRQSTKQKSQAHAAPLPKLELIKQFPDSEEMLLNESEIELIEFLRSVDAFSMGYFMVRVIRLARAYQEDNNSEKPEDLDAICMVNRFAHMVGDTEVCIWQNMLDLDLGQ